MTLLLAGCCFGSTAVGWATQTSGTAEQINGIAFLPDASGLPTNTGFGVGGNGMVLTTTDGGGSRSTIEHGTGITNALNNIAFSSMYHGVVVGDSGTILSTINGGGS